MDKNNALKSEQMNEIEISILKRKVFCFEVRGKKFQLWVEFLENNSSQEKTFYRAVIDEFIFTYYKLYDYINAAIYKLDIFNTGERSHINSSYQSKVIIKYAKEAAYIVDEWISKNLKYPYDVRVMNPKHKDDIVKPDFRLDMLMHHNIVI